MKKIKNLVGIVVCLFLFNLTGFSQNPSGKTQVIKKQPLLLQTPNSIVSISGSCGADYIRKEAFKRDPQLKLNFDQNIQNIKAHIAKNSNSRAANSQYRIPVVVHVIHNGEPLGTGANISDAQIQSQINRLNSSFDNIGGGTNSVFTDITFCLAQNGPNGSAVTWSGLSGVNRLQDAQTHAGLSAAAQVNLMSAISWPSNQYLNIWIVSTINGSYTGVIGYAPQPLTGGPLDGVVIQANVFGDNSVGTYSLLSGYGLGMTMVHEAGHYLGLYHTFQGASCTEVNCNTQGDMICDTPPTSIGSTCTAPTCTGAQVENYMDYTFDACKNTYTQGQTDWMHATITTMRSNLVSPANLTLTGVPCAPAGLLATFTQSVSQICEAGTVTFTATTIANTATSFIWTFPGGTPSTATGVGPHSVTYATAGDYDVVLETNDGTNNLINTSVDAVYVTNCGSGITGAQAQWYFQRRCAVDFTSGVPVGFIGSLTTNRSEGAASVCDASGNLEFYTDGLQAWDGTGSITSSLRTLNPGNESPAQGAVIVPDPSNVNNYYVFSNPGVESTINQGVRYSLYEGATQDFPTTINQPPTTNYRVTEHLAAAPHCNGTDYWVIYHGGEAGVNDKFLAYQLSASGVSATPVISNAFSVPITPSGNDWIGQIDIAPNGRLMAATNIMSNDLYIYEIDRATGQITLLTSTPYSGGYGVSFSPNSEFLYVAKGSELRQYNVSKLLECGSNVSFETLALTPTTLSFKSLQIGPDGKIYINRNNEAWLDVLNYPNQEITFTDPNAVGYNDYAVFLPSTLTTGNRISLPNMIDVPLGLTNAGFEFCITNCGDVDFHNLSCGNTFSWDFGDMNTSTLENPSHTYAGPGAYTVTFTATTNLAGGGTNSSTITKTININVPATPSIVGPQLVDCPTPVNQFAQYTPSPFDPNLDYYWTVTGGILVGSNPTDVAYVDWSGSGSIKLVVIDPITGCTDSTTINVYCKSDTCGIVADLQKPNAGSDTTIRICDNDTIPLSGSIAIDLLGNPAPFVVSTWTQIDGHPSVTFLGSANDQILDVTGFTVVGTYMFEYSFSRDTNCYLADTVFVIVDSCEDCPEFYIYTCCDLNGGVASKSSSSTRRPIITPLVQSKITAYNKAVRKRYPIKSLTVDSCCMYCEFPDVPFPIFVYGEDGNLVDTYVYTVTWSHHGPPYYASDSIFPDSLTIVTVSGPDSCFWSDTFLLSCCDDLSPQGVCCDTFDLDLNIDSICATDPCDTNLPNYPLYVTLNGTGPLGYSGYFFTWSNGQHANQISIPRGTQHYWVAIYDSAAGCTDTAFYDIDCITVPPCVPVVPTNLNCNVSKSGIQTLTWATTPGLTYQVEIIYNDPFCVKGGTGSTPVMFNVSGGSYTVNVSPLTGCLSWRVRSICPNGTRSAWTAKQCCCKPIISWCNPTVPTNLRCQSTFGGQLLTWNSVAGATYEITFYYGDPKCCKNQLGYVTIPVPVNSNSFFVSSTRCFSWQIRSVCPNGKKSAWTKSTCSCSGAIVIGNPDGGKTKINVNTGGSNNQEMKVLTAPNPARDFVTFDVKTKGAIQELGRIEVSSITGEMVFNSQIKLNGKTMVDLTSLKAGTYIYKVISDGTFKSGRIVITE